MSRRSGEAAKAEPDTLMKYLEYSLSVLLAMLLLGGLVAWTHADYAGNTARFSCRAGKASPAVTMKGLVVYPRCYPGKRS